MKYRVTFLIHRRRMQRGTALSFLTQLFKGDAEKAKNALKNGYVYAPTKSAALSLAREMEGVKDMKVSQYVFNCAVWQHIQH